MSSKSPFVFPELVTPRLRLRVLTLEDAEDVYQHFSSDEVTRYMDIESCQSIEEAKEIIAWHLNDSGCRWGVFDKLSDTLLGTCGYHCWEQGEASKAEIGYDLSKVYWGKGYMKELLPIVIDFGFRSMKLKRIEADVESENQRSSSLLKHLGFSFEGITEEGLERYFTDSYL